MNRKFRMLITALICLQFAAAGMAANAGRIKNQKFISGVVIMLPAKTKLVFSWLMPPQESNGMKPDIEKNLQFAVDGKGTLWLGRDNDLIANFSRKHFMIKLDVPYREFVSMENGMLIFSTDKYIGFIPGIGKNSPMGEDRIMKVPFQPLVGLPEPESSIYAGDGDILYIKGFNAENGTDNVYSFGGKGTLEQSTDKRAALCYKEIFSIKKHISAVAGNGKKTYVAMGRMIAEITKGMGKIRGFFVHPQEDITGMAYSEKSGLFYTTDSFVGYAGENGPIDFIRAHKPRIVLKNNTLYVFMADNCGILKINNIDDMKKHDFKSKKKSGDGK